MSMDTSHYVGFYLKCSGDKKIDKEPLLEDEKLYKICDESGNKLFREYDIYIPNVRRDLCFTLDKHSETGIRGLGKIELFPAWLEEAFNKLELYYDKVEAEYDVITYVN